MWSTIKRMEKQSPFVPRSSLNSQRITRERNQKFISRNPGNKLVHPVLLQEHRQQLDSIAQVIPAAPAVLAKLRVSHGLRMLGRRCSA